MTFYLECTNTFGNRLNTGIQRVVRNLVNLSVGDGDREVVAVRVLEHLLIPLEGGIPLPPSARKPHQGKLSGPRRLAAFVVAAPRSLAIYLRDVFRAGRHFLAALLPFPPLVSFLLAPHYKFGLSWMLYRLAKLCNLVAGRQNQEPPVEVKPGDVLVLLDATWNIDVWPAAAAFQEKGGIVVVLIYDLIPFSHPQFFESSLSRMFNSWLEQALRHAHIIECISRTTAEHVRAALPVIVPDRAKPPRIGHFWLGSELDGAVSREIARPGRVGKMLAGPAPLYLFVSTIEPRKNHDFAINSFDLLWQDGVDAKLAIVGKIGWRCERLIERIQSHKEFGKRLFMINDADDAELALLYERSSGLVFTSIAEGFGLPIVEALQRGLPVFASDIPVFREIGSDGVTFVDLADPPSLARALSVHIAEGAQRLSSPVAWMSWQESTREFWRSLDFCLAPEAEVTPLRRKA